MNVLIEITKSDTVGNKFINCLDCALSRAVKRVVKPNMMVIEGINNVQLCNVENKNHVYIPHEIFSSKNYYTLKNAPNGTVHILEMDIPKDYLRSEYYVKVLKIEECSYKL